MTPRILTSQIHAVDVHATGATVYRAATLTAADGVLPRHIEIPDLPLAAVDATVSLRATDGVDLALTDLRIGLHVAAPTEVTDPPEETEIRALQREIQSLSRQLVQARQEQALLASLPVPERPEGHEGQPPPASPLAARLALESFLDGAIGRRLDEARALTERLRQARRTLAALVDQRSRASTSRKADARALRKTVLATLHPPTAPEGLSEVALELSYFVPGARWTPTYRLDVRPGDETALVSMRALVCQRTGEDWSGVKLRLSTADPGRFTTLPVLRSRRIGRAQPAPPAAGPRPAPTGAEALFADHDLSLARCRAAAPKRAAWSPPRARATPLDVPADLAPPAVAQPAQAGAGSGALFAAVCETELIACEEAEEERVADAPVTPEPRAAAARASAPPPAAPRPGGSPKLRARSRRMGRNPRREPAAEAPRPRPKPAPPAPFSELRLAAPDQTGRRGRLHHANATARYRELLKRCGLEIPFDPMTLIAQAAAAARAAGSQTPPAGTVTVRKSAGHWGYAFRTDAPVDVPADGGFHSIPVCERASACGLQYVAVPRQDPAVYRIAKLHNAHRSPLLPGPAEISVNGAYVVSARLPLVAPGEHVELGIGVEPAIRCTRRARFSESRSGSRMVATTELIHDLEIDLRNDLPREVQCEIRERIPQPAKDAEVVVEEPLVTPAWEPYDQEERGRPIEGGRRWKVALPPGQERELRARYVVKIYANNELVGGNRREA